MKRCLILIKHSLPEIEGHIPAHQWHLSENGRLRALRLADQLLEFQPGVLVSSVEPKARETAEIISQRCHLDVQMIADLHEHDRGQVPYLSKEEFQSAVREFFLKPDRLVFGSETANAAHSRFARTVDAILQTHKNETVMIVSHGTVISLFVSRLTGISGVSLWCELGLPSFVVLDMNSNTILAQENIL